MFGGGIFIFIIVGHELVEGVPTAGIVNLQVSVLAKAEVFRRGLQDWRYTVEAQFALTLVAGALEHSAVRAVYVANSPGEKQNKNKYCAFVIDK